MFHVVDTTTGETVYKHYDKTECNFWVVDALNAMSGRADLQRYIVVYVRPANGIAGMAWTD
jgi:hypothetical protein